ncbi:glycine zipper domain-containing protein [uncultured Pseudodesulfovibrio sp.]|uniref:glycine zipper domain-containing protein n=1 Tax=uncultured Pseudodesulfovibrio sp. TaxID=2035858 RepID=UPI0029C8CD19|nr:YMGG-like glycine zipper-containing protein [uncultured Pseudodesulfovibrio sp.]
MKNLLALILMISMLAACQTTQARNSAAIGTLAGATLGALTFKNKISGAAIGAGAGMLVGYIVGNEMDKYDRTQVSSALENAPSGQTVAWRNPDTHTRYEATPRPARRHSDGRIERDVTLRARMPNGEMETVYAKAYRQPDGTWQLVQ